MANGRQGANPARSLRSRLPTATASPGTIATIGIAAVIALLTIITYGEVREGVFLALVVFILLGALVPPVAIALGAVMIVALFMRGAGTKAFDWLGSLGSAQPVPIPDKPEIGERVTGYVPSVGTPGWDTPPPDNPNIG